MPSKNKAKQDTDFSGFPGKLHFGSSAMGGAMFKEEMSKPETAEHYAKKEWNPEKNKFDYIYPSDLEKKGRRDAKNTMKASEKGEIPKKLQLSNIAKGTKVEMEHNKTIDKIQAQKKSDSNKSAAKLIAKDHIKEDPEYYAKLKKMETADMVETAGLYNKEGDSAKGDYKGGKKGRTWKWGDHKYRARIGPKGDYRYDYTQNQRVPHTEAVVERKQQRENERASERAAHEGGMVRLPNSGELQNPGAQGSRPSAGFRGRAPSPRMAPQSKARHMQNSAVKGNDVNIKGMMQGPGKNTQMQGPGNPVNNQANMAPAKQAMQGFMANTMADQARGQGNSFSNQGVGNDDFAKQDSSLNPLSPKNLTPEQQQRFGQCHDMAKKMAMKTGGQRYTTSGRNAGFHSITVNPDRTVYDYVLGINGMPLDRYLSLVPYSFTPNP